MRSSSSKPSPTTQETTEITHGLTRDGRLHSRERSGCLEQSAKNGLHSAQEYLRRCKAGAWKSEQDEESLKRWNLECIIKAELIGAPVPVDLTMEYLLAWMHPFKSLNRIYSSLCLEMAARGLASHSPDIHAGAEFLLGKLRPAQTTSTLKDLPVHAGGEALLGKVDASPHTSTLETPTAHAWAEALWGRLGPVIVTTTSTLEDLPVHAGGKALLGKAAASQQYEYSRDSPS
ncbi:hypothetical protein THAOC_35259 [Thalassiosira oceanica]|uniref:Uncharacterized protein n=1 Tax=Thalassiosira oceanica TaxID=159749 RepID=K0R232_THAOC|nr:hypothetical protein THAOC_35259 [Thalassiosira oceanica]|eukprot:EJK46095.1 hypothetical protein THAOC_35259 [Thalassiosira oceanica]